MSKQSQTAKLIAMIVAEVEEHQRLISDSNGSQTSLLGPVANGWTEKDGVIRFSIPTADWEKSPQWFDRIEKRVNRDFGGRWFFKCQRFLCVCGGVWRVCMLSRKPIN